MKLNKMTEGINKLKDLYIKNSKHSNYQIMPSALGKIIDSKSLNIRSRQEKERLDYILKHVDITNKSIIDIGGNTGYFVFEMLDRGASSAVLYEGNKDHVDFVSLARDIVGIDKNRLKAIHSYYSFDTQVSDNRYDIALLLNVLHHIGDDYGRQSLSIENAKNSIIAELNSMATQAEFLIFQLGFNLHGDITKPLFVDGTKQEMITFIEEGVAPNWEIESIGVAEDHNGEFIFSELNDTNIKRNDSFGEFLNRPIFVMKSKNKDYRSES